MNKVIALECSLFIPFFSFSLPIMIADGTAAAKLFTNWQLPKKKERKRERERDRWAQADRH